MTPSRVRNAFTMILGISRPPPRRRTTPARIDTRHDCEVFWDGSGVLLPISRQSWRSCSRLRRVQAAATDRTFPQPRAEEVIRRDLLLSHLGHILVTS